MTDAIIQNLIATVFAIFTTIIGAIFGYILSEGSTQRREARTERRQAVALRTILSLEVARNLETLLTFWMAVKKHDYESADDRRKRDMSRAFVDTPLPAFSRETLSSQLSLLALFFQPDEITRLFRFYDRLDQINLLRREMVGALRDQQQEQSNFQKSMATPVQPGGLIYAPRKPFDELAIAHWETIESTIKNVLDDGNPLQIAPRR